MDGLGQSRNGRSGDHDDSGVVNGHSAPWASHRWSSAGAALEPSSEPLASWNNHQNEQQGRHQNHASHLDLAQRHENNEGQHHEAEHADRRGIEALTGGDDVNDGDDSLTTTLVRPPHFVPFSLAEDPYADELAQRSAEFARHAAFDDATPPTGLPSLSPTWQPPVLSPPVGGAPQAEESALTAPVSHEQSDPDPPLAASLSLGQRFEMAFGQDEPGPGETVPEPERESPPQPEPQPSHAEPEPAATVEDLPQRVPFQTDVPTTARPADDVPLTGAPQLRQIMSHLRREDTAPVERPDGFDTDAVLSAVRAVAGVREATLRTTPAGAHHLRLELAEGADPGTISRMVARMLQDQMGLDAALAGNEHGPAAGPPQPQEQPRIPGQQDAAEVEPPAPPVTLPGPRTGAGATPPAAFEQKLPFEQKAFEPRASEQRRPSPEPTREPRRRHPVSVPRRQPSELRPAERLMPTWRAASDIDQPAGAKPPSLPTEREQGPRAIIEHVQTSTFGLDATVEVRLTTGDKQASGVASGPAVDAYVLRLCAAATAAAVDDLLGEGTTTGESGRCFVEHAAIVPMGSCDVAVVVVLLVCGGWVEQLAGSALVAGDPRRAVVRAALSAVNRRLAALLPGT